jgi:YcxB-like protein
MRLTYAVTFEDFKTLQTPFTARAGNNPGYKGVLAACGLISSLGVFLLAKGAGLPVGLFLIGLGIAAAAAGYFYEQYSVHSKKKEYDKKLDRAFQEIHCRDERIFEANENGFTTQCKCGTVTRPWSELTSFSENKTHLAFNTKAGGQILPKSAFPTEAEVTEFRELASGKLNQDKPITAPHLDFALSKSDLRSAYWLHTLKGGGWRSLMKTLTIYGCMIYVVFAFWHSAPNDGIRAGMIGGLVVLPLLRIMRKRRRHYFGSLRIYFTEEGLHLQDPANQARTNWKQFVGYLEANDVLLLYYNPKLYRIIPKRSLTGPASRFQTMVETKLNRFDYRNPGIQAQITTAPTQTS